MIVKVILILYIIDLEIQNEIICYYQSDNKLGLYPSFTKLYNAINRILPMNKMLKLIIEKVFYNLSNIPNFNCNQIKD